MKRLMRPNENRSATPNAFGVSCITGLGVAVIWSHHCSRNPELYQLPYQGRRQGPVRWKADGALAGVVVLELVLEGLYHSGVEGAVVRGGTVSHKQLSLKTESGELVA